MPDLSSTALGSGPCAGAKLFSRVQGAALDALIGVAEDGTGCAALIGEAGTGKTAVLDATAALLGYPPVRVIRVAARWCAADLEAADRADHGIGSRRWSDGSGRARARAAAETRVTLDPHDPHGR